MTTLRFGSMPSDSLRSPAAATASCTIFRSNAFIAPRAFGLAGPLDFLGGAGAKLAQVSPPPGPVAADVEHQPGPPASLPVHREPGQLLQRVQHLAAVSDQLVQGRADNGDHRTVALHVHVDVAIEVSDIEQALDVVGRYLALDSRGRPRSARSGSSGWSG